MEKKNKTELFGVYRKKKQSNECIGFAQNPRIRCASRPGPGSLNSELLKKDIINQLF